jgi:hypothetical protein
MQGILKGKKTYVTAALSVIGAVAGLLVGDLQIADAAQLIVTALLGATIRNGIK